MFICRVLILVDHSPELDCCDWTYTAERSISYLFHQIDIVAQFPQCIDIDEHEIAQLTMHLASNIRYQQKATVSAICTLLASVSGKIVWKE